MKQESFRFSFPLGTKILLSVVGLVVFFILVLNSLTIFLFQDDKRADIYKNQLTSVLLAGKEFLHITQTSVENIKNIYSLVTVKNISQDRIQNGLKNIFESQKELIENKNYIYSPLDDFVRFQSEFYSPFKNLETPSLDLEEVKKAIPSILKKGVSFFYPINVKENFFIGIFFSSPHPLKPSEDFLISFGWILLDHFKKDIQSLNISISDKEGNKFFENNLFSFYKNKSLKESPLFKLALKSQFETGTHEFEWEGKRYLGSFFLPGSDWVVLIQEEWKQAMVATYKMIEKFILLGIASIGFAIFFTLFFSKSITAPIGRLYDATLKISEGNFLIQLSEKGGDEIASLSQSFNLMSKKISDLIQESMKKVQLENELKIASMVQQTLLPSENFKNEFIQIQSYYRSASQCGGDWWSFFQVGEQLCIMIADATGHGLPSALITAAARGCFSVIEKISQENSMVFFSPSQMLSFANRVIFDASMGRVNMTFFVGVIDFKRNEITYSNAGHNPPWLAKKEEGQYTLKSLVAIGSRLGESKESIQFEEKKISFQMEDYLFFYTDGLTEGKNSDGEIYGKKRVRKILLDKMTHGSKDISHVLSTDFIAHNGEKELDDDVTFVICHLLKKRNVLSEV